MIAIGSAIEYLRQATGVDRVLERGRAFRAELAMIDRAIGIALDINDLPVLNIDIQATADSTIRADALKYLGIANAWSFLYTLDAKGLRFDTNLQGL